MLYLEVAQGTAGIQLCQALGGMQQLLHRGMGGMLAEVCGSTQLSHQTVHTFLSLLDQVCGQLHRKGKQCGPYCDSSKTVECSVEPNMHPTVHGR